MNALLHSIRVTLRLLLSATLGALSVADKPYELLYLGAPVLAAGGGTPQLSVHAALLGQVGGCLLAKQFDLLPVLLLIYLLRGLFSHKKGNLPPAGLISIMMVYQLLVFFITGQEAVSLLLGGCNALLSGCVLFFATIHIPTKQERHILSLCNRLLLGLALLTVCSCPALDELPLIFTALLLILYCGRLQLWQGALGGVLCSVAAALIGQQTHLLSVYLGATAAVCVMARFGKKRYTGAMLLCSELALLPTGAWVDQLLLLLIPPLSAGVYMLLPEKDRAPRLSRQPLNEQYRTMVERVEQLQRSAEQRIDFYPEIAARAAALLTESGATDVQTTCAKDLLGGFFLDISFNKGTVPLPAGAVLGLMERASGFALAADKYYTENDKIFACFVRRPPLTVRCAALCKTKEGETVCGDSAIAFSSDQRHYILLLSDGMGSGQNAFVQSRQTVNLLQKLLRAGMNAEGAIGMVHSSLKLAQQDVAFATADLCSIDLLSGRARFIKAGAVSTFILRDEKIMEVCGISMPLGAAEEPDVAVRTEQLQENDLLLLISDGAYERKDEILYALQRHRFAPLQQLAQILLQVTLSETGQAEDDITILIAKICKHREEEYEYKKQ